MKDNFSILKVYGGGEETIEVHEEAVIFYTYFSIWLSFSYKILKRFVINVLIHCSKQ